MGCDFAGTVVEVGAEVKRQWKAGDRVCGFAHGSNVMNSEDGAFGEYLVARGDICMKIPDNMGFEEAATLPVGVMTCVMGLYQHMGLSWLALKGEGKQILIYGGSTATGMLAIQFAKL
jgi:NADPH:quinone reductase-like Zn-dependent oxidoreductase